MKPIKHGGLKLESKGEFEATLAAITHVLDRSQELEGDFGGTVDVYGRLRIALTAQFDRKEEDIESGEEGASFATEFDQASGGFVVAALRLAADHQADPAMREQAGDMIMDYTMAAAALDMEGHTPGEGQ